MEMEPVEYCECCETALGNLEKEKCGTCTNIPVTEDAVVSTWEVRCPWCRASWGTTPEQDEYVKEDGENTVSCPFCEETFSVIIETITTIKSPSIRSAKTREQSDRQWNCIRCGQYIHEEPCSLPHSHVCEDCSDILRS